MSVNRLCLQSSPGLSGWLDGLVDTRRSGRLVPRYLSRQSTTAPRSVSASTDVSPARQCLAARCYDDIDIRIMVASPSATSMSPVTSQSTRQLPTLMQCTMTIGHAASWLCAEPVQFPSLSSPYPADFAAVACTL